MLNTFKNFLWEEDGLGTVEIVIIVAVLVAVALLFRKKIYEFVDSALKKALPNTNSDNFETNNF